MYEYTIEFIAANHALPFKISSAHKDYIETFVKDLIVIFSSDSGKKGEVVVEAFQKNSDEIMDNINDFVSKYAKSLPEINMVSAFFRKLRANEDFCFLPSLELTVQEKLKIYNRLKSMYDGVDYKEVEQLTSNLFDKLLEKYTISSYGDKRFSVGERDKAKRVCRFCNNQNKPISYKTKAHAISEALGNKSLVLYDECDKCNHQFSQTIERDVVEILSIFRTIFDVKGKGGSKTVKGVNFEMRNDESVRINFDSKATPPEIDDSHYKLNLELSQPVVLQNVYRCLCKYFVSLIDKQYLPLFSKTIDWINGKITLDKLPLIAERYSYQSFSLQPRLTMYLKKANDNEIPYAVGEFYFTCKILVFIVPLVNCDVMDFSNQSQYDKFWDTFLHYNKSKDWAFNDYSSSVPKKQIFNMNFRTENKIN